MNCGMCSNLPCTVLYGLTATYCLAVSLCILASLLIPVFSAVLGLLSAVKP